MENLQTPPSVDAACIDLALAQRGVISRTQAMALGLSDRAVQRRLQLGVWRRLHPGVYLPGAATKEAWATQLSGACLAGGSRAVVSHRAAAVVFGLDGLVRAPAEITVPHLEEAALRGVIVHRSRLLDACDVAQFGGLPVTRIERALIDLGRFEGDEVVEKALESAIRLNLTTEVDCWTYAEERGRGLPGARRLARIMRMRAPGPAAGSAGEVKFLRALRQAGVPAPVRQFRIRAAGKTFFLDFAWPDLLVAAEFDGYQGHGGRLAHAADLDRQNAIVAQGWSIRRYSPTRLAADPVGIAAEVTAALLAAAAA